MRLILSAFLFSSIQAFAGPTSNYAAEISKSYEMEAAKKPKEAIDAMMGAFKKDSDNYFINYRLGYLFAISGVSKNALEHYEKATKASPRAIEPLIGMLNIHVYAGKWSEVERVSKKILTIDPLNSKGGYNFIRAAIMLGNFSEGLAMSEKMLAMYPTDAAFMNQKGLCLEYMKRPKEAQLAFREVLAVYPLDPIATGELKKLKAGAAH